MNAISVELKLSSEQYDRLSTVAQSRQQPLTEVARTAIVEWLEWLRRQNAERAFIDGALPPAQALEIPGVERIAEIEYARQALLQDIARGLSL